MKYLLDTNICIYYMKGRFGLDAKFDSLDVDSLFISEITLAELKFGVAKSAKPSRNSKALDNFLSGIQILPIFDALDTFASEKARLRKEGRIVDDFDLLIGASAIANDLTLVTNNEKHFERLKGIKLENWAS
ncbi:MAG: type II toxin-antitoxin system tRNA(fMet)-specific endonuclease VapC [Imperialibacter sp.]|uniref:type II toxin-antitoxin system tRNA(fMet)-specific endonuclease VapC n=1 Tax=unclassified Imperialibacter TaxID=2629706 RepID=UPI001252A1D7|nr:MULTISPECIES: type II toxin-antitoxin system VapC family toxin [unclassified Imperialibacter]VVT35648.1 Ribonuclease VapC2 [Imperialibacter sp. EC-SDR9]